MRNKQIECDSLRTDSCQRCARSYLHRLLSGVCVAACCSVLLLQYVAVCCSVLQCVAVCFSVLQYAAMCCSVLQCAAVCCGVLQYAAVCCSVLQRIKCFWRLISRFPYQKQITCVTLSFTRVT